jgi:hypothetical protein
MFFQSCVALTEMHALIQVKEENAVLGYGDGQISLAVRARQMQPCALAIAESKSLLISLL